MRPSGTLLLCGALALCGAGLLRASDAEARVEGDSAYTKAQTYNAALRYIRVDLGYEVLEKDPDAAYVLFKYLPPGQKTATDGSIEVIEARDDVKIFVQLPKMPEYHEVVLRDGLMKKLRQEYGAPPPRQPKQPDKPRGQPDPGDGGSD